MAPCGFGGDDRRRVIKADLEIGAVAQGWLSGGAKNKRAPVGPLFVALFNIRLRGVDHRPGQFLERIKNWLEEQRRQGLDFIKNDDGLAKIVELAGVRGAPRKQGVEKLDGRGDNDGRVPVFSGQLA